MLFSSRDHRRLADILTNAARKEIMPRFRNLKDGDVRQKLSATDLVTEADEAAERLITSDLNLAFPGALVVGEEAASADPRILKGLAEADLAIVVDPVDGTLNYAAGLTIFATMAAAIVRGEVVAAVIHDPILDDSAMALRGEGAWSEQATNRTTDLRVAKALPLSEMTGMVSWRYFPEPRRSDLPSRFAQVTDVSSLRCCGQEYRLAAAGNSHFLSYGRLMPWDHSPGTLLFREAGGYVALTDASPYRPGGESSGLLCAPDKQSWAELRDALFPPLAE